MANTSSIFKGSRAKILAKDGIGLELNQDIRLTDGVTSYDIQPNINTGTLEVSLEGTTFAQIGQSLMARIRNDGVVVAKAALVYSSNVSGHKIIVKPAIATSASQVAGTIGWTTGALGTNVDGYAQISGVLDNVKTDVDSDGNALSVGDLLYVSASVAGGYTKVAPTNKRLVGVVMEVHQNQGKILCQLNPPISLEEITNVKITSLADLDMLRYDSASGTWKNFENPANDTLEPNGFVDPSNIGISYDSTARTVTITHSSGTIEYYYQGVKKTKTSPWTTDPHTNTTGNSYFFYIDGSGASQFTTNSFPGFDKVLVAYVSFGATNKFAIRETHGLMQWQTHGEFHETVGTYRVSGGLITAGSYALNTNTLAAVTPVTDSCVVADEDLNTTISALTDGGTYTTLHFLSNVAKFTTGSSTPYLNNGTNPQINTSGSSLTAITTNNTYWNVYAVFVPATSDVGSQAYRVVWLTGQTTYGSSAAAQSEDFRTLNLGNLSSLFTEFVPFVRVTYRRDSSYTNTFNTRIDVDPTYLIGNKQNLVSTSGITPTDHGVLTGRSTADSHPASAISNVVTGFAGILSATDTTGQAALDTIDDYMSVVSVSSNVTLTKNRVHLVDTTVARSLTLPTPVLNTWITVKDKTGSAQTNNITIVRAGSEKIETVAADYTMSTDLQSLTFVSDGTDWFVV